NLIRENHLTAEKAFEFKVLEVRDLWSASRSTRLKERLADLNGLAIRMINHLMHRGDADLERISRPSILVAREIGPGLTVQFDREQVIALVSEEGTRTSHAAILAHSMGMPAVMGLPSAVERIDAGTMLVVDGTQGTVLLDPSTEEIAEARSRDARRHELHLQMEEVVDQPAVTTDGQRIVLRGNVDIQLMIPLVTRLEEVDVTREMVAEEGERLARSGIQAARSVPVGVMVETPAAAVMADRLAQVADFLSVGTNDLTQYTLVVDRGNARLADRFTPHDPSVLRLLKLVANAARAAGKPASVCGEMASEPVSAFLLLGLGYETLSVAPPALPLLKWVIRQVSLAAARSAADAALAARSASLALDIVRFALADTVDLQLIDPGAPLPAARRKATLNR